MIILGKDARDRQAPVPKMPLCLWPESAALRSTALTGRHGSNPKCCSLWPSTPWLLDSVDLDMVMSSPSVLASLVSWDTVTLSSTYSLNRSNIFVVCLSSWIIDSLRAKAVCVSSCFSSLNLHSPYEEGQTVTRKHRHKWALWILFYLNNKKSGIKINSTTFNLLGDYS